MSQRANRRKCASQSEDPDFIPPKPRGPRCADRDHKPRAAKKKTAAKRASRVHALSAACVEIITATVAPESPDMSQNALRRTDGASDGLHLMCAAASVTQLLDKLEEMGLSTRDDVDPSIRLTETIRRLAQAMHIGAMPDGSRVSDTADGPMLLQYVQMLLLKYLVEYM